MGMGQHLRVNLSAEERQHLLHLVDRGSPPARTVTRARILLMADRSTGNTHTYRDIGSLLHCHADRISRTCRRYVLEGLHAALVERPRTGAPPKITGDLEAKLVMLACSDLSTRHFPGGLEKVRLRRENRTRLPMSWPS